MKVAITGKGGVGKTTFAATLARLYAAEGRPVLAADVDPDANLGLALGLTEEEVNAIVPVSKMKELARERTAANQSNTFYKLNPEVSDLPDKLAKEINCVKLLVDQFIVVIEPGARSIQTYTRIKQLAKDIGITRVRVVANKVRNDSDREFLKSRIPEEDLLGYISYNPEVIDADRRGLSPYDCSPSALAEIRAIKEKLDQTDK